jgi:hypothetical protein
MPDFSWRIRNISPRARPEAASGELSKTRMADLAEARPRTFCPSPTAS